MTETTLRQLAANGTLVRLLIDHPHAYREWQIVGSDAVPGFYHIESSVDIGLHGVTKYELCLHETQFERIP
jgi:hypothetical protein